MTWVNHVGEKCALTDKCRPVAIKVPVPLQPTADAAVAQRLAWERRMLDPAWREANCPRPDKVVWLTREGAEMQRADMLGKPWFTATDTLDVYECACGGFHVGNNPARASAFSEREVA